MCHKRKPEKKYVGQLLAVSAQLCKQRMDESVQKHGLTNAQSWVLLCLIHGKPGEEINQRDLQRMLRVSAPTINGIVERMEEKGFIARTPGKRDGRCRSITVTEKGLQLERELSASRRGIEARMVRGFSEEERKTLEALLQRVIENLKGGEEKT